MSSPRTLFDKIWDSHIVLQEEDSPAILFVDLHLIHEVTSPQAFDGLREKGLFVRSPERTVATMDHSTPTIDLDLTSIDVAGLHQIQKLETNCQEFGIPLYGLNHAQRGIVHVIGPELGLSQPGLTIVCGDSHTSTHGAFGALAFGIGTSEVEHVLATQSLLQDRPLTMQVEFYGQLPKGVTSKDLVLALIKEIGIGGGIGYVIEYTGDTVKSLDMEGRMTLCNMSIEAGARAGLIAPDQITFDYLDDKPHAPQGAEWDLALSHWKNLKSDKDAEFDKVITLDVSELTPMITYGTNPEMGAPINSTVPEPKYEQDSARQAALVKALDYMGLNPGQSLIGQSIDVVFIGSCTNGRLSDLRSAASVLQDQKIAPGLKMIVVPGSENVRRQAEEEGLDKIFLDAGAEWRYSGCSMCLAMNGDQLSPGQYAISTSNRNFEGRQGRKGRTFLASPLTAAASAISGQVTDPRTLLSLSILNITTNRDKMKVFQTLKSSIIPLPYNDVDTDQIIPAQYLKVTDKKGLADGLFSSWRYHDSGEKNLDFPLNDPQYQNAEILLAGDNFGCGSSREHAPWALVQWGIRAIFSTSFADIFYNNALKNGLLPIEVSLPVHEQLLIAIKNEPLVEVSIDLPKQVFRLPDESQIEFSIDPFSKKCLVEGIDPLGYLLKFSNQINFHEKKLDAEGVHRIDTSSNYYPGLSILSSQ